MINYISNTTKSNQIFISEALNNEQAIFVPKLMHAGPMTISDYISFGKKDFDISDVQPILDLLEINNPQLLLSSLPTYKQLLIHYFAHLIIDREHVLIELPTGDDLDLQFIDCLFEIIEQIDFEHRRLTMITADSRVINHHLKTENKHHIKSYKFKPTSLLIIKEYIGRKGTILVSLLIMVAVIILSVQVDNKIINDDTEQLLVPTNLIAIKNTPGSCSFNQYIYDIEAGDCPKDQPITYLQLMNLLEDERIDAVYFDDKNHILNLNNDIAADNNPTASLPDLNYDFSNLLPTLPCLDSNRTAHTITCENYNPDTSLISKATNDNREHLQQNIELDKSSAPDYIFLETNDNNQIGYDIAAYVPSISIYTVFAAQNYILHANLKLLTSVLIIGTIISVIIAVSFFILMNAFGITIRGLRYRLIFQTGRPRYVKHLYLFSQTVYFGSLIILGSLVSINVTHSLIAFGIGVYFGILNSILWIILAIRLSPVFSGPESKLLKDIADYRRQQKKLKNKQDK